METLKSDALKQIYDRLKDQDQRLINIERLLKKLVKGETAEKDEIITSAEFRKREGINQDRMSYILKNQKHLKCRIKGKGLCINYTQYKKLFQV